MTHNIRVRTFGVFLVLLGQAGCALQTAFTNPTLASRAVSEDVDAALDTRLLLVGDAGKAASIREPVLSLVRKLAAESPDRTTVVFLGDNVYPNGIPPDSSPARTDAIAHFTAQVQAATSGGARAVFVAGNHDHCSGISSLRDEAALTNELGDGRALYLPEPGQLGPAKLDVNKRVRLLLLDSELWIDSSDDRARADATRRLHQEIESAGDRHVVVAAHHPLATHGVHGGFFPWEKHVFPLTEIESWLYLPLPIVGSAYPLARESGISDQDLSGSANRRFRGELEQGFTDARPLIYASGHEHALQVLEGTSARYLLVSGSGTVDRPDPVSSGDDTLFASPEAGFMRLDFLADGRVRLIVVEVPAGGVARTALDVWL